MAYSPGVAGPCRVIADNEDDSFSYTGRANLVGGFNGSAVLGLGNIGPYASKPVWKVRQCSLRNLLILMLT